MIPFIDYSLGDGKISADDYYCGCDIWSIYKFWVLMCKWLETMQEDLTILLDKEFYISFIKLVYSERYNIAM